MFSGQAATAEMLEDLSTHGHHFELLAKPVHPVDLLERLEQLLRFFEFSGRKRTLRPRIMTKATVKMQTAAIKGQLLSIGIGSADGLKGIIVPRLSQFVSHSSPDVPPKVEAAGETRIKIIPLGSSAPA